MLKGRKKAVEQLRTHQTHVNRQAGFCGPHNTLTKTCIILYVGITEYVDIFTRLFTTPVAVCNLEHKLFRDPSAEKTGPGNFRGLVNT